MYDVIVQKFVFSLFFQRFVRAGAGSASFSGSGQKGGHGATTLATGTCIFYDFRDNYYELEMKILKDVLLKRESDILTKLID